MFKITEISAGNQPLQVREELLTGYRCRISPSRLNRRLDTEFRPLQKTDNCPFCPDSLFSHTPTFPDGWRICVGESVTFPNLFPFSEWHTVTVMTKDHYRDEFSLTDLRDALEGQRESLIGKKGYPSINWNYLPSAGASIAHPHLQGMADVRPPPIQERYIEGSHRYLKRAGSNYWEDLQEHERNTSRFLFGKELFWYAHFVPLGEREVRCVLPSCLIEEFDSYINDFAQGVLSVIRLYRYFGTHAFNMSLFFGAEGKERIPAFCSIISRINPNNASISDTAFMERLHLEPVILTLPEELGDNYRRHF